MFTFVLLCMRERQAVVATQIGGSGQRAYLAHDLGAEWCTHAADVGMDASCAWCADITGALHVIANKKRSKPTKTLRQFEQHQILCVLVRELRSLSILSFRCACVPGVRPSSPGD